MINKWLIDSIIGLDLCPFTKKPFFEGKILIEELASTDARGSQDLFLTALSQFQGQSRFETALLVYPFWEVSFRAFYDFSQDCDARLGDLGLEDEFQLVAFHPQFAFAGLALSDRANLVNSSPFPLIHVLRIHDLNVLNMSLRDAKAMSYHNSDKLEMLSEDEVFHHFPWRNK